MAVDDAAVGGVQHRDGVLVDDLPAFLLDCDRKTDMFSGEENPNEVFSSQPNYFQFIVGFIYNPATIKSKISESQSTFTALVVGLSPFLYHPVHIFLSLINKTFHPLFSVQLICVLDVYGNTLYKVTICQMCLHLVLLYQSDERKPVVDIIITK